MHSLNLVGFCLDNGIPFTDSVLGEGGDMNPESKDAEAGLHAREPDLVAREFDGQSDLLPRDRQGDSADMQLQIQSAYQPSEWTSINSQRWHLGPNGWTLGSISLQTLAGYFEQMVTERPADCVETWTSASNGYWRCEWQAGVMNKAERIQLHGRFAFVPNAVLNE